MDRRVSCPVVGAELPVQEATSFRIVEEVGGSFFLDFLSRCPQTFRAVVVLRVRMQREALVAVKARLASDVVEFPPGMAVH